MKIRRGPKSTGELELTDQKELEAGEWTQQRRITLDITKGSFALRNSIVEVELTEADVDTLSSGLQTSRNRELLKLRKQVQCYRDALFEISRLAMIQPVANKEDFAQTVEDIADRALDRFRT